MNIRPLHLATREEITALAQAALEHGEPIDQANPFMRGSANWQAFNLDYFELRHSMTETA